jgi:glycosyltransferase involved in cell wall biosynthesis
VYKKYNHLGHYVSISNADRSHELDYLATVYNGLDTADFEFYEKPGDSLLYFGRIHPHKGTAEAIEIAKKSKRKLLIAGIIQDENYYREKVEPFLSADIEYIGHAGPEKRRQLLGNALALLHPISFDEPFGMSVAEAMLCGTPVIAFNRGSMPELIEESQTGYLVNTVDEAVEAVEQLNLIKRIDCYHRASTLFSKEKMVNDYFELYKGILG